MNFSGDMAANIILTKESNYINMWGNRLGVKRRPNRNHFGKTEHGLFKAEYKKSLELNLNEQSRESRI